MCGRRLGRASRLAPSVIPLRRNRDFLLLQAGQFLSSAGSQATTIAYPLLTLAATHSAAWAGAVGFARLLPAALWGPLAGVAADRFDRRLLMIGADVLRAAAIGGLAAAIAGNRVALWQILVVAFVEGSGSAVFDAAKVGALRAVVEPRQLPAAVSAQTARTSILLILGPTAGGVLFELARWAPFLVDAASYACSMAAVLGIRTGIRGPRERALAGVRRQLGEGLAFLWGQPFLRTCAFLYGLGNFAIPGVLLVIVVAGGRHGLSGGRIGALLAGFGAALLVGSVIAGAVRRRLSMRATELVELVSWVCCAAFLAWPDVYVLAASIMPLGMAIPITDSVVVGYRIAITPDRLLGRVESVRSSISLGIAPLGPLVAGLLLSVVSARETMAVFFAVSMGLLAWGWFSPSIRNPPSLDELDALPARGEAA